MENFIVIMAIAAIAGLAAYWMRQRENRKAQQEAARKEAIMKEKEAREAHDGPLAEATAHDDAPWNTRDLLLELLKKMNCKYEIDKDDRILFQWQGGNFIADASNKYPFIIVWYIQWGEGSVFDIDSFSRVKRVINEANIRHDISVFYTVDKEADQYLVHSKKHFLLIASTPHLENYLQSILAMFFEVRRYVETETEKLKNQEESVQK